MYNSIKMMKSAAGADAFSRDLEFALDKISPQDRRVIENYVSRFRSYDLSREAALEILAAIGVEIIRVEQREQVGTSGVKLSDSLLA